MQDKLDEYEAENRLPDEELSAFYEKMKQDVMSFVYGLEAEVEWWNFDSSGIKVVTWRKIGEMIYFWVAFSTHLCYNYIEKH